MGTRTRASAARRYERADHDVILIRFDMILLWSEVSVVIDGSKNAWKMVCNSFTERVEEKANDKKAQRYILA